MKPETKGEGTGKENLKPFISAETYKWKERAEERQQEPGIPNNKQWPTVTDNDFRKLYRSLEIAVERLKHHEFYNKEIINVLELILNENKHFKQ